VSVLPFAAAGSADAAQLAAMLALLVGACYLIALVLRLGWVSDYLSRPVLVGYMHGVVVVLIIGQLGKLLGISISATDPIPQLVEAVKEIGEVSAATIAVSAAALAVLLPLRFLAPRFPAALVVGRRRDRPVSLAEPQPARRGGRRSDPEWSARHQFPDATVEPGVRSGPGDAGAVPRELRGMRS
jgi:Sulfate permease family